MIFDFLSYLMRRIESNQANTTTTKRVEIVFNLIYFYHPNRCDSALRH